MKTSTIIEYGAVDITAKADSTLSATDKQSFSNLSNLKRANLREKKYSTLERNFFVLDGKSENMADEVEDIALWSNSMTNDQGNFTTPPVLTITFTKVHTSIGLTLTFSEYAYCTNLKIQYYDGENTLIKEETYSPDNYDYFCEGVAENYKKIVITFYSLNMPHRYLKLYKILYGQAVLFEGENLVSANILEQLDVLSNELTVNTLDFTVYSNDDRFNILNPEGVYATLQERQSLSVYEVKNDEIYDMGTFYIKEWKNKNNNKMEFKGIDLIGLLDGSTFDGGMYTSITAEDLITSIFDSAGFSSELYSIDSEIRNVTLTGYLPIMGSRDALQQVLFVLGAVANCARSDIINIYKIDSSATPIEIERENIFKNSEEIKQGELITGVKIKTHNYVRKAAEIEVFSGELPAGTSKVLFEEPVYDVTASSGTIDSFGTNYVIITLNSSRSVIIYGKPYKDNMRDIVIPKSNLIGDEKPNVLQIESIYLINNSNAQEIGQRIMNYYDGLYQSSFKHILDQENTGEAISVAERFGNVLNGYIRELDINLTGGYISKTKIDAKVSVNS